MTDLFKFAREQGIPVEYADIPLNESMSVRFEDGSSAVALDWRLHASPVSERVHAAHEIGHCATGSFYNVYAPLDVRGKHERHADAWAIHALMPWPEVQEAMRHGCTTVYDLAEEFGVTDDFARKAMELYRQTN